jgi:hypothetical protein
MVDHLVILELYPNVRTEIDLRDELAQTINGSDYEISKGQLYILRRMRRVPDTDALIPCSCFNPQTKEGSSDVFCPYCHGEGHLWDEEWFNGIRIRNRRAMVGKNDSIDQAIAGYLYPELAYIYTAYDLCPTTHDRVIMAQMDVEGYTQWPVKIAHYYYIEKPDHKRSDEGRLEYWRLTIRERLAESTVYG